MQEGYLMLKLSQIISHILVFCLVTQQFAWGSEIRADNKSQFKVKSLAGNSPKPLWVKELATHENPGSDWAYDAVVDRNGNSYITGTSLGLGTGTDFMTIRMDATGQVAW